MGSRQIDRRSFLLRGLAVISWAPFVLANSRCDKSTSTIGKKSQGVVIANQPTNTYVFDFATYPALATPGGFIQVGVNATSGYKTISIVRADSTHLYTVLMICPYSHCNLAIYGTTGQSGYYCPCDGSVFEADGSVRIGPSTVPLNSYTTNLVGASAVVTIA